MGITIKSTINKWTKIPVRIGIGPTKTLAKVAGYQIKKYDLPSRVLVLNDKHSIEKAKRNSYHKSLGSRFSVGQETSSRKC